METLTNTEKLRRAISLMNECQKFKSPFLTTPINLVSEVLLSLEKQEGADIMIPLKELLTIRNCVASIIPKPGYTNPAPMDAIRNLVKEIDYFISSRNLTNQKPENTVEIKDDRVFNDADSVTGWDHEPVFKAGNIYDNLAQHLGLWEDGPIPNVWINKFNERYTLTMYGFKRLS